MRRFPPVPTILVALVSALLLEASPARATHFRFGSLSWKPRVDLATRAVEFQLVGAFRRDGFQGTGADGFAVTGDVVTETIGETKLFFGDGASTSTLLFKVTAYDVDDNWIIGNAVGLDGLPVRHTYSGTGPYVARIDDCCRISPCAAPNAHLNNPDGSYRVETIVTPGGGNSSPVTSLPPIVSCPKNGLCTFSVPASDDDGDPVTFRLSTTTESKLTQPGPSRCPSAATIGSQTGLYLWNTTGCALAASICSGGGTFDTLYSTQVTVEEPGGKTAVDFFIRLADCSAGNAAPAFGTPTPACGSTVPAHPGQAVSFTVAASDPNAEAITLNSGGLPVGSQTVPSLPLTAKPVQAAFTWTPAAGDVGQHVLTFSATDPCSAQSLCSITIDVSTENCTNVVDDDGDALADCADPDCAAAPECLAECGNGIVEYGEECDDPGNATTCGCGADCRYPTTATTCSDGDACTRTDVCNGDGECVGSDPKPCPSVDACHEAPSCDPSNGSCGLGAFTGCTILAARDTMLRVSDANANEGGNGLLAIYQTGVRRAVVGFDLVGIDLVGMTSATLELVAKRNDGIWPVAGDPLGVYPLSQDFAEGNGKMVAVPVSETVTRGSGTGATYRCAADSDVANVRPDCRPSWSGAKTASGPLSGSATILPSTLGPVTWDVTADVAGGKSGWLVRKPREARSGAIEFWSREGAATAGDSTLAPKLVLRGTN
ncbi:hypothetical protein KGQ64_02795 [bacterium]|nr:hypothetical protein [bacterium]